MYQVARLNKKTLITPREVVFHAPTDHTVDVRHIENNIIIAEERFIAPVLGRDFYEALTTEKNTIITSANRSAQLALCQAYLTSINSTEVLTLADLPVGAMVNASENFSSTNKDLWNGYLWKLIAECVEACLIVPSWLQHTAQGQQKNNPDVIGGSGGGSVTGDMKDVKFKLDNFIRDRIDPLTASLRWYLNKNYASYPLFVPDTTGEDGDGIAFRRKSAFVIGLYDDIDNPTSTCTW